MSTTHLTEDKARETPVQRPTRYQQFTSWLGGRFRTLYQAIVAVIATVNLILIVFVSLTVADQTVLAILALCEAAILALAYRFLVPLSPEPRTTNYVSASHMLIPKLADSSQPGQVEGIVKPTMAVVIGTNGKPDQATSLTSEPVRGRLLRYGIAALSLSLCGLSLFLVLGKHDLIDDFLLIFPLTAFFPFSYLAYATFQREVRVKRLQRDFNLLGILWDSNIERQTQGFGYFAFHITLAMLFTVVGISFFTETSGITTLLGNITLKPEIQSAMQYGFLGSYLFAIQLIYRRYTTYDLHPSTYMYAALTILAGLIFNYVAFQAIHSIANLNAEGTTTDSPVLGNALVAILAFALGFFPLLAVQWMSGLVNKALGTRSSRSEDFPLSMLDGVSTMHETRLRDFGIDNIQNLAAVDLRLLLINTPFTAQEVVDWVDQAILYLYLELNEIESFRQAQVRTVSDFREMWKPMYDREIPRQLRESPRADGTNSIDDLRKERANALLPNTTPEYMDLLYEATNYGPNLHFVVHYWRNADRERKIDYLFHTLPERNSPKYNFALGQTFLEYARPSLTVSEQRERDRLLASLNEVWLEIEKFPINIEETMTLNTALGWAGLAFLKRYFASNEDFGSRHEALKKSDTCYRTALELNKHLQQQIEMYRHLDPVSEWDIFKNRMPLVIASIKRQLDMSILPDQKDACLRNAAGQLRGLRDYLAYVLSVVPHHSLNQHSQTARAVQHLTVCYRALTEIAPDGSPVTAQPLQSALDALLAEVNSTSTSSNGVWHGEEELQPDPA